jgi:hypothetical protein
MESEPGKGELAGYVIAGNGRISALFPELRRDGISPVPHLPIPFFYPEEARYGRRFPVFPVSDPVPWEIMYTRMEKSSIYLYFQNISLKFAPKNCSLFRFQRPSS